MTPAEQLLAQFDRLAGPVEPTFCCISPADERPPLHVVIYGNSPVAGTFTAFTVGLSHFHPSEGGHKELVIRMRDDDYSWAHAVGLVAYRLRKVCPFTCGDTVNFRERICSKSPMNAFLICHPQFLDAADRNFEVGNSQVEIAQLVPIFEQERLWLLGGGSAQEILADDVNSHLADPRRRSSIMQS